MIIGHAVHSPLARHRSYRRGITQIDYFVMWHLREFIDHTLRQVVTPGARVADIGCGEQPWRRLIESLGGAYTGIDVTQNRQGTVQVIASVLDLPGLAQAFDVVLCSEVLEHVPDSQRALAGLAAIAKPNGRLVLTTPFTYPLHEEPHDFLRLTPHLLARQAHAAALEVVTLECAGNEIEVLATVWAHLWPRERAGHPLGLALKAARRGLITAANVTAWLLSQLAGRRLPLKLFLNLMCVLARPGSGMPLGQPVWLAPAH